MDTSCRMRDDMMAQLRANAPAKLNLTLHILGKREDGYHELESLVVFLEIGDEISIQPSDDLHVNISGLFSGSIPVSDDNIVLKAARALQQAADVSHGASIRINKQIPVGAGLGGGSADAAATLHRLNQLWGCAFSLEQLCNIGQTLGADVPACLHGVPLMMTGIGEHILPVGALPPMPIVLVNPAIHLLTKHVYDAYLVASHAPWQYGDSLQVARNDLESAAIALCPTVKVILEMLAQQTGCVFSRLCGSGSTCFGVFENNELAQTAADEIHKNHPHWWVRATKTL